MKATFMSSVVLSILVVLANCSVLNQNTDVTFEVTGSTTSAWVVYSSHTTGVVDLSSVALPWSISFSDRAGDWVELDAGLQSTASDSETLTATIYRNGSVLMTASRGPGNARDVMTYGGL